MSALHNLVKANNLKLLEKLLSNYLKNQTKRADSDKPKEGLKDESKDKKKEEDENKTEVREGLKLEGSNTGESDQEKTKGSEGVPRSFKLDSSFIDKRDEYSRTPLHIASYLGTIGPIHPDNAGNLEIVKLLVKFGANVHSQAQNNMTSLHFASQKGHLEVVQFLCKHGAKVNTQTNNCMTPVKVYQLHFAILGESLECAVYLIGKGAKQKYNKKGQVPLELASESMREKLKQELKDKFESFERDVPSRKVEHKETVQFYKKRKKQ